MRHRNVLVVYYSMSGNTARVARDLASRLDADVESLKDPQHVTGVWGRLQSSYHAWRGIPAQLGTLERDPANYTLTIVGSPVWACQMTPAVRAYAERMQGRFNALGFFVTSGDTSVKRIAPSFEKLAGKKAIAKAGFSARELADPAVYEANLASFVRTIEASPTGGHPLNITDLAQS